MLSALSKIWTRVAVSISLDGYHFIAATSSSLVYIWMESTYTVGIRGLTQNFELKIMRSTNMFDQLIGRYLHYIYGI